MPYLKYKCDSCSTVVATVKGRSTTCPECGEGELRPRRRRRRARRSDEENVPVAQKEGEDDG